MINVENKKMSKSKFNFFTVREIGKEFDLEVLRFFLLSAHYRSPINFSKELLTQAKHGLERLYNGKKNLEYLIESSEEKELTEEEEKILAEIDGFKSNFKKSMEDDLNTADGIASLLK